MIKSSEPTFTAYDVADIQAALRRELVLPVEHFPIEGMLSMLNNEMEEWSAQGKSDEELSEIVSQATGKTIPQEAIAKFSHQRRVARGGSQPSPVTPPSLPPDFPDVPQNPGSDLQPVPDPAVQPNEVAGAPPRNGLRL